MKRGEPLRRTPLARGKGPSRETRVRPVSVKRQEATPVRRNVVALLLAEYPRCQARWLCDGAPAQDVHERLSRARGGSITDLEQSHAITACRPCHTWLTDHPGLATRRRLLLSQWHTCPPIGPC